MASTARQSRPDRRDQVRIDGNDLLRVLVIGSGVVVGHGVTHRRSAFDGPLARALSAGTGRGVYVLNVADPDKGLNDQILAASVSGSLDLEDAIVWSPSVLEMCGTRYPRAWGARLRELLALATSSRRVVVLTLPVPEGGSPFAATGAALARQINVHLRRAARRFPTVSVVDPPALQVPVAGAPELTPAYYEDLASVVSQALLPRLLPVPAAALAQR